MARELTPLAPPALPEAGVSYYPGFFTQYSNVLRIFFNRVVNTANALVGRDGGTLLEFPSGAFYSSTSQTIPVINTAYSITYNNLSERRITVASNSRITVSITGLYQIEFIGQLRKVSGGAAISWFWLRKNGADLPGTGLEQPITGSNVEDHVSGAFLVQLEEDDYVELIWAANSTAVVLLATAAAAPIPALPSVILNITYVSMVRP